MADEITLDAPETRLERFLAAAAGVEGITLDEPETRIEKYLYKIAQGGGSGGGALAVTLAEGALDKTWQEIHDAFPNVYIAEDGTMNTILMIYGDSGEYGVVMADGPTTATFVSTSASGYPAVQ